MIMNNGQIRNIIWDWNGTLLNDMNICIDIMNTMLANRAIPLITADLYREVFTFPVRDYMVSIGFDFSKEPFNTPADEFVLQYDTKYAGSRPFQRCPHQPRAVQDRRVQAISPFGTGTDSFKPDGLPL
jgi:phosphoglycolate phosphatase-like HAD superfamily hydrolase